MPKQLTERPWRVKSPFLSRLLRRVAMHNKRVDFKRRKNCQVKRHRLRTLGLEAMP